MAAGSLLARDVVLKAQRLLNDIHHVNWELDELVDWLNAGQRQIVVVRPDASSTLLNIDLSPGVSQAIPENAIRLLDVLRNVDGRAITYIKRGDLDNWDADWVNATPDADVVHWMYDDRSPDVFRVYPPQPDSPGSIEALCSITPEPCTLDKVNGESIDSAISINDIFEGPLIDYIVYRSYSKDATYTVRGGKADIAWQHFLQTLGVQLTTDKKWSPDVNTPPHQTAMQPGNVGAFK
jgi:hypothetical protein